MSQQRYFLPDHEELFDTYTREELRTMLLDGDLSRSDIVVDDDTGLSHLLGDLLSRPHRSPAEHVPEEKERTYREFSVDSPLPARVPMEMEPYYEDDDEEDEDAPEPPRSSASPPAHPTQASTPEYLLNHLRPSWLSYPKSLLAFLAFTAIAVVCYQQEMELLYVIISGSLAAACLANISLDRSTTDYFITNKRVEAESGVVGRNSKEIRICDIRAIDVRQEGFIGLLGVGTVDFSSAGGSSVEVQFKNIGRPHKIKKIVRELQG
jgi:Bacterial PH domain